LCVALAIAWLICTLPMGSVHAQNRGDSDTIDLILQIKRGRFVLSDAIFALQKNNEDYYIPMLELSAAVGIVADADLQTGTVSGWYFDETNTYRLDSKASTLTIGDTTTTIPQDHILVEDYSSGIGEIYVHIDTLNKIWPLYLEVNFGAMRLDINTPRKLPFERAQDRQNRWDRFSSRSSDSSQDYSDYIIHNNPYRIIGKPLMKLEADHRWHSNTRDPATNFRLAGKSDLLGFSATYNASWSYRDGDFIDRKNARLRLQRQAFGDDTMPLGLRHLEFGDVGLRSQPLVRSNINGRGFYLSSKDQDRDVNFDVVTIDGSSIPGWDVELYRNDQLIAFNTVDASGQYIFRDVDLLYGHNTFRTVLYGPSGQTETRIEKHTVDGSLLKPGETTYEIGAVDGGDPFLPFAERTNVRPDQNGQGYSTMLTRGISRQLTVFGGVTRTPTRDGTQTYMNAGANFTLFQNPGRLQIYKQMNGGTALDARYLTSFMGWRLNLRTGLYNGYESEYTNFGQNAITSDIEFRANKSMKGINFGFKLDHTTRKNGYDRTEIQATQTFRLNKVYFNNQIRALLHDNTSSRVTGRLTNSYRFRRYWNLRSTLNYDLRPDYDLRDLRLNLRYNKPRALVFGLNVNKNLNNRDLGVGVDIGYDFGTFTGSIDTNWVKDQGTQVLLRATTSLAPYGVDGSYIASSRNIQNRPAINGRVFIDENENNIFDDNEMYVPDANVVIDGKKSNKSNADGIYAEYETLREGWAPVFVNQETLANPFLAQVEPGYYTLLRAGSPQTIDIPLIETGSIDGTAYFESGNPVPGLRIELVDENGRTIADTISGYDGFYLFEFVKPGQYTVRTAQSLQVRVPPHAVAVSSEKLYVYGIDLTVQEQLSEVVVTEDKVTDGIGKVVVVQDDYKVAKTGNDKPAPLTTDDSQQKSEAAMRQALAAALQPKPSLPDAPAVGAVVNRVRIGEHPDKLRVWLDLSAPADYRFIRNVNGSVALILPPNVEWKTAQSATDNRFDEYRGYTHSTNHDGTQTLLFDLPADTILLGHGLTSLPAFSHNDHNTHQIYIDIKRK